MLEIVQIVSEVARILEIDRRGARISIRDIDFRAELLTGRDESIER